MQKVSCPYCKKINAAEASFCSSCGKGLGSNLSSKSNTGITKLSKALSSKYEIIAQIGQGGMAKVYKAIHKRLDRMVALKVIHANLLHDEESLGRFRLEARASASLLHPNIVMVYDEGEAEDIVYLALEFLDGEDLNRILQRSPTLPYQKVVDYILPIARALDYVHNRKLVHRDIKSSNIFITGDERPVLTDFGIASLRENLDSLTLPGTIIGTPEFMSPEQANDGTVDGRSDLYSLGVVMYQCLTGKVPLKGETPISTILKITQEIPVSINHIQSNVPNWLSEVIDKCLEKNPQDRYQTGLELANALKNKGIKLTSVPHTQSKEKETVIVRKKVVADDDVFELHLIKAEEFFDQQNFTQAFSFFNQALKIKPDDEYVKDKLGHLNQILESINSARKQKELTESNYNKYVKQGEEFFNKSKWDEALESFQQATRLKRFEKQPKNRIKEISQIKFQIESQKKELETELNKITSLLAENKFGDAESLLSSVSKDFDAVMTKGQVNEINNRISEQKNEFAKTCIVKEINDLRKTFEGESNFENFTGWYNRLDKLAIEGEKFEESKKILANFRLEIEKKEKLQKEEQLKQQKLETLLFRAKNLVLDGSLKKGLEVLQSCLQLDPNNEEIVAQMYDVEEQISRKIQVSNEVTQLIERSDEAYEREDYQNSIKFLERVLELDPSQKSIKILIKRYKKAEEKQQIKKQKEEDRKKDQELEYQKGLESERNNNLEQALKHFTVAQKIFVTKETEFKIKELSLRIEEIKKKRNEEIAIQQRKMALQSQISLLLDAKNIEEAKKKWNELIELSEKNDSNLINLKNRIEHQEKELLKLNEFHDNLRNSNQAFDRNENKKALEYLESAAKLFPKNELVKNRIELINNKIDFEKQLSSKKGNIPTFDFDKEMQRANRLLEDGKFEKALLDFQSISEIRPNEKEPRKKIAEINSILAVKKREKEEQKRCDKEFSELLKSGSVQYELKEFDQALRSYEKAFMLKPDQFYLKDRIDLVKERIELVGKESAKEETITNLTLKADTFLNENKLVEAKTVYELMLEIQPNLKFAVTQIEKVNSQLSSIEEERKNQKKNNELYRRLVSEGDKLFELKEFTKAIGNYEKAKKYKDTEYLTNKIELSRFALSADQFAIKEKERAAIALNNHLLSADRLRQEGAKKEALQVYKIALVHFPNNQEIESNIQELEEEIKNDEDRKVRQNAEDSDFHSLIEKSNLAIKKRDYEESIKLLKKAIVKRPNNSVAQAQLSLISSVYEDKEKAISESNSEYKSVSNIMTLVASLEKNKEFEQALSTLQVLKGLKLKNVKQFNISEIESRIKRKALGQLKKDKAKKSYDLLISKAFSAFKNEELDEAIDLYQKAIRVNPDESYPKERISQIKEILANKREQSDTGRFETAKIKQLAERLRKKGSFDEAIEAYELLVSLTNDKKYEIILKELAIQKRKLIKELKKKTSKKNLEENIPKEIQTNEKSIEPILVDKKEQKPVKLKEEEVEEVKSSTTSAIVFVILFFLLLGIGASYYLNRPEKLWVYIMSKVPVTDTLTSPTELAIIDTVSTIIVADTLVNASNSKLDSLNNVLIETQRKGDSIYEKVDTKKKAQEALKLYQTHDNVLKENKKLFQNEPENTYHTFNNKKIAVLNLDIKTFKGYYNSAYNKIESNPEKARVEIELALDVFPRDWNAIKLQEKITNPVVEPGPSETKQTCSLKNFVIKPDNSKKVFVNSKTNEVCLTARYDMIMEFAWSPVKGVNRYFIVKRDGEYGIVKISSSQISVFVRCAYDGFDNYDKISNSINGINNSGGHIIGYID